MPKEIVWAKETFWIHRATQETLVELTVNEKSGAYMHFVKDCPYNLNDCNTHGIISDYLKPMMISNKNLDLLFYTNAVYIGKMRDKRITEILA